MFEQIIAELASFDNIIILSQGLITTISVTASALFLGLILSFFLLWTLNSQKLWLKISSQAFIFFTRGVPLLVQIFMLYYGAAQFEWLRSSIFWEILQHPFCCATIVLGLNSSAYTAVILQGCLAAIPKGELEACRVLNLSPYQQYIRVIIPRIFGNFWPLYSNEAIMVLKSTSIVSTITLMDLMGVTRQLIANSYQTATLLITAGILYLLMSTALVSFFQKLDRRFNRKTKSNHLLLSHTEKPAI
jgi:His/Glu/Gln/Arg/opine family amino acid ABC transporter permease subunit